MSLFNKKQTLKALRGRKLTPKHRDLVTGFASLFFPMSWILLHPSLRGWASWWNHLCVEMSAVDDPNFPKWGNFGLLCERPSVSFTECKSSTLNPKNIHQTPYCETYHPGGNMASCVGVHPKIHAFYLPTRLSFPPLFHKTVENHTFPKGKQNGRPPKRHQTSNKRPPEVIYCGWQPEMRDFHSPVEGSW